LSTRPSPDELVPVIAEWLRSDAELSITPAEQAAWVEESWSTIRRVVGAMDYDDEGHPRPQVDTTSEAEALKMTKHELRRWAQDGAISTERVDSGSECWWSMPGPRPQIANHSDSTDYFADQGDGPFA
jgi:hypothetical protein